ncbi:hypothetical protein DPSP01_005812 [Paraphaeosphaeria sporulosa]
MKGYVAGALLLQTARAQLPPFQFPQAGAGALPPLSLPAVPSPSLPPLPPLSLPALPPLSLSALPPLSLPPLPPLSLPALPPLSLPALPPLSLPARPPPSLPVLPSLSFPTLPPLSLPALSPLLLPTVGGVIPPGTDDVVLPEATLPSLSSVLPAVSLPVLSAAGTGVQSSSSILTSALPAVSLPVLPAAGTGVQFGPTILPNIRSLAGALAGVASSAVRGLVVPTLPAVGPPQPAITPGGFGAFAFGDEGTPTPPEEPLSDALNGITESTPLPNVPINDVGVTDAVSPAAGPTGGDTPLVGPLGPADNAAILPAPVDPALIDTAPINDVATPIDTVFPPVLTSISEVAAPADDVTPPPVVNTVTAPVGNDPFAGVAPVAGSTNGPLESLIPPVAAVGDGTAAPAAGFPIVDDLGTVGAETPLPDVPVAEGTDPSLSTDLPVSPPIFDPGNNFPTVTPVILPIFATAEDFLPIATPQGLPTFNGGSSSGPLAAAPPDQSDLTPPTPEEVSLPAVDNESAPPPPEGTTFEPPQVISAPVENQIGDGSAPFETPIEIQPAPVDTPIEASAISVPVDTPLDVIGGPADSTPIEAPNAGDPSEEPSTYDPNDPNTIPIEAPTGSDPTEGQNSYDPNTPSDPFQLPNPYDPIQQQSPPPTDSPPYNPFTGANDGPYVLQKLPIGPSGYDGDDNSVYDGEGFSSGSGGHGGSHGSGGPHRGQESDPSASYGTEDTTEYDGQDYGSDSHSSSKGSGKKPKKGNGPPASGSESDSEEECPEWCLEDDSSSSPEASSGASAGNWASSTVSAEYSKETGGKKKHKKKKSKKAKKPKKSHRIAVSVDDNVVYTNEYKREVADDAPSSGGGFSGFVWPSKKTDATAASADNSDSSASKSSDAPAASASSSENFDKEISDQLQKGSNGQRVQPDLQGADSSSKVGSDSGDGVSGSTLPDWLSDLQKPKESGASKSSGKKESSGKPTGSSGGSENDAPRETSKSSKKKKAKGKCPKSCKNKKPSASGGFGGKPSETGFGGKPSETGSGGKPSETGFGGKPSESGFGGKPSDTEAGGKPTEAPSSEGEKPTNGAPEETLVATTNPDFAKPTTLLTLTSPKPDEPTEAPVLPPADAAPTEKAGFPAGDVSSGDTFTGSTLAGVCPKQCNPFNPTENLCDHDSTGCTTAGGSKYYCACRAGFKLSDGANKDFSKQFKVPGQPYVYVWPGAKCDKPCESGLCDEVLVRDQCV